MNTFKAAVASAALFAATGFAFAQESAAPAPQAPAATTDQAGCPAPGSVPEADLPANCKMNSTQQQTGASTQTQTGTGTSTDSAATAPAQSGTSGSATTDPAQSGTTDSATTAPAQNGTSDSAATGTTAPADQQTTTATTNPPAGAAGSASGDMAGVTGADAFLASNFIGQTVYSAANENVGEINDLILAKEKGAVMAVVGVGGFLGIGEKNVAVPMENIQINKDGDNNVRLVINLSREQLESSPAFDRTAMNVGG